MKRTRLSFWLAAINGGLAVLIGCGGDTTEPTSPPSTTPPPTVATVASVSVAPNAVTTVEGDTVRLAATVRSTEGATMTNKVITWSSSAASVATVSTSGLVSAVSPGSAAITAAVDGKSASAQVTVLARITLDVAKQVSEVIGGDGGSITTTSSGGAVYTLVVPPNALGTDVTITMTPVSSLQRSALSGGVLAGVKLEPSGTQFARPLELRVSSGLQIPAGRVLVGFTTTDNGETVKLLPAIARGSEATLIVPHFSIVGLGAVLPSELAALAPPDNTGGRLSEFAGLAALLAQGGDQLTQLQRLVPYFAAWYDRITPMLNASGQGDTQLLSAIPEYVYWVMQLAFAGSAIGTESLINVPELRTKAGDGLIAVAGGFTAAITRANSDCAAQRSLTKANLVLFWQSQAEEVISAVPLPVSGQDALLALGLDRSSVLEEFCLQVIATELTFPDPFEPNETADLKMRFGVKFGTNPNLLSPPHIFDLHIELSGTNADGPVDVPTAADGRFTQTVVPTGNTPFHALIKACLEPLLVSATDVCTTVQITANAVVPPPPLAITTTALPNGIVNTVYSHTLQATGGTGVYSWSITSGQLPQGLSLNAFSGTISGTPTAEASVGLEIQVTSGAQTQVRGFSLTIGPPAFVVGDVYVGTRKFQGAGTAFPAALIFNSTKTRAIVCAGQFNTTSEFSILCGNLGAPFNSTNGFTVYNITMSGNSFTGQRADAPGTISGTISGTQMNARQDFPSGLFNTLLLDKR